jgi:hypothetical protein
LDRALVVDYVEFGGRPNYSKTLSIEKMPTFSAAKAIGETVFWSVEVPPKMIENVRERLKEWDRRKAELQKQTEAQARNYFSVMDANKDGRVQPDEWNPPNSIKPAFEKAKIDLTKDMTEKDFIANYIRVFQTGKQKTPEKQPAKSRRRRRN